MNKLLSIVCGPVQDCCLSLREKCFRPAVLSTELTEVLSSKGQVP